MSKIVVIAGHPNLQASNANRIILEELTKRLDNLEIRQLAELYPDYKIDVAAEQQALLAADVIIFQAPLYWYSVPAIMKKWIDDVMSFNFAYGPEGDKLKDKHFFMSLTIGGPEDSYSPLGYNHFNVEQFLRPFEQLAYLAQMNYQKPVYTNSMVYIPGVYNKLENVQNSAKEHAKKLIARIDTALNSTEDTIKGFVTKWFNQMDILPEDNSFFFQGLADNFTLEDPTATYQGKDGFNTWYKGLLQEFAGKTFHHNIQAIIIAEQGAGKFSVNISVDIAGTNADGSQFSMHVLEDWIVTVENKSVSINTYKVTTAA